MLVASLQRVHIGGFRLGEWSPVAALGIGAEQAAGGHVAERWPVDRVCVDLARRGAHRAAAPRRAGVAGDRLGDDRAHRAIEEGSPSDAA